MSRTKTEDVAADTSAVLAASSVTIGSTAKKIGVIRYLQLYPQDLLVEDVMKSQYKSAVKTIAEWDKVCASVKKKLGIN